MTDPTPPVDPAEGATPEQTPATPPPPPAPPTAQVDSTGQPVAPGSPQAPMNTLAVVAFIVSFFISIGGIVLGHISLSQIKKSGERGRGFALAGTIIGYVALLITIISVVMAIVFAGIIASAANETANELSQSMEQSESAEPDATTEEPAEPAGDRSAEFCDAFKAANDASATQTNDDGTLSSEAIDNFQKLADASSPNQAVYQRFVTVAKDPAAMQKDESPDTLMSDYIDAVTEDSAACM